MSDDPGTRPVLRYSPTEHVLRLFTDVRPGEGRIALLLFANVLLILCAYYFVKPLREGWLAVSDVGGLSKMEIKAYSSFAQGVLLIGVMSAYGRLVSRWPRRMLITRVTLFCISNMVIFWALQPNFFLEHLPGAGIAFYLWVGMFGVFVIAQFWAFAADVYDEQRGKRLLPVVALGATSGAVIGSWLAEHLVAWRLVSPEYLLLAAVVPLLLGLWLMTIVDGATHPAHPDVPAQSEDGAPAPGAELARGRREGAIRLVFQSRFLLFVGLVTLLLNWVNTNGENLLFRVVQDVLQDEVVARGIEDPDEVVALIREGTTAFYSDFFFWVNLVALGLQAFVASRVLKYGGFGAIFLMLPVIALGSYAAMALIPVLGVIKVMKIAENSTDYSISNTARHVLWLPLGKDTTYKAKPTIDSLFVRLGDGLAALTVLIGVQVLVLSIEAFFILNIALIGVWLAAAIWVVRAHRKLGAVGSADGLQ